MNIIEMGQLKFKIEEQDQSIRINVEGAINEDLHIEELSHIKTPHIIFEMNDVKMINSCGIREWIRLVESFGNDISIEYVKVPQIVVQQMNMISGFLTKNAKVTSFYAPYFIEDLDEEKQMLLNANEVQNFKAPKLKAQVGENEYELDFDAIEEQYFRFLKR